MSDDAPATDPARRLGRDAAKQLPQRFYKTATVEEGQAGFGVLLDGRPIKTPDRTILAVPTRPLAQAIADEWSSQITRINPLTMPMTRLANTALVRVRGREAVILAEIVAYAGHDLLCYRAEGPLKLVTAEHAAWDPVIEWAHAILGARPAVVTGIVSVPQPPDFIGAVHDAFSRYDAFALCALHNMTTLTSSVLLACAVAGGHLTAEQAWAAAHVDEDFQIAQWGQDHEAQARRADRWQEMRAAGMFLELAKQPGS